jgi:mono/diheme cytochrome c family protein
VMSRLKAIYRSGVFVVPASRCMNRGRLEDERNHKFAAGIKRMNSSAPGGIQMARKDNWMKPEQSETARRSLLCFAFICALLAASAAAAQTQPSTSQAKGQKDQQPQVLINSVKGPDLFREHCATCHGADAKGNGPAASALKTKAPDLTILAKNNGGQFPTDRVRKQISGDEVMASHGSREMPIFGSIFRFIEPYESLNPNDNLPKVRLDNLVAYLQSIQRR